MISEKELLELFHNGINCLSERKHLSYETFKEIERLLKHCKIQVKII